MAEPQPQDRVRIVHKDGRQGSVPAANLGKLPADWRIETADEAAQRVFEQDRGALAPIGTALEEGLSAATLGGYDVAGGAIGGEEFRERRRRSKEADPLAASVGVAGGIIAPALLTGGTSAAAQGVAKGGAVALAKGAAGTVARTATAPARAAMALGRGAESLAAKGLARVGVTGESALGRAALGAGKMTASGAVEGSLFGAGQALSEAALAPGGNYDGLAQKLWAGAAEGAQFGALAGGVLGGIGGVGSRAIEKLQASGAGQRFRQWASDVADSHTLKAQGYLASDSAKLSGAERHKLARRFRDYELETGEPLMGTFETLETRASKIATERSRVGEVLSGMRKRLDEVAGATDDATAALQNTITRIDQRAAELGASAATGTEAKVAKKLQREFAPLRERLEAGQKFTYEESHAFRRKLDDSIKWGKRGQDAATDEFINARKVIEEEFEGAAQKTATAGGDPKFLDAYHDAKTRYSTLAQVGDVATKRAAHQSGNRSISLSDYVTGSGLGALTGGLPGAIAGAAINKAVRSTASDAVVARLMERIATVDRRIDTGVRRWVARGSAPRAAIATGTSLHTDSVLERRGAETRADAYFRKVAAVEQEANAPERAPHPDAPQTSRAMEATRKSAAQFLLDKAPAGSRRYTNPVLARIARQRPPDEGEMRRWARYVQTVENPLSVVDSLENGTLNRQQVEALQAVYPSIYQDIRQKATDELIARGDDMPYHDRIQLGVLLGIVADPSMRPASLRLGQRSFITGPQEQQQRPGTPGSGGGGGPDLDIADDFSSYSQELEGMETM